MDQTQGRGFTRRKLLYSGAGVFVGGTVAAAFRDVGPVGVQSKAPELIGAPADWVNTGGKPLKLYGAGGLLSAKGPVLIDFWDYTCVNCIRTMPHLRAWHQRYKDMGLTIIGIHTPEFEFAKDRKNVVAATARLKLPYPVVADSKFANWNAYGNQYWPRKYLIDTKGIVVYDHAGEGGYVEAETAIRRALLAAKPNLDLPVQTGLQVRPSEMEFRRQTPEIYAGYVRGSVQFGSPGGLKRNAAATYADVSGERRDGFFYARGSWKSLPESIRHARATANPLDDYIAISYMALEANAVIRPEGGKPFDLYLLQDGKPIPKADKGDDVKYDAQGRSYIRVDAPRMYRLAQNQRPGRHELRLGTISPDFGLYSFAFSSSRSLK